MLLQWAGVYFQVLYLLMDVVSLLNSVRRRDFGLRLASPLAFLFTPGGRAGCRPVLPALDPIACTVAGAHSLRLGIPRCRGTF
jgi:hypothetical protein